MSNSDKESRPTNIDRTWWRNQGADACIDRMILILERAEKAERELAEARALHTRALNDLLARPSLATPESLQLVPVDPAPTFIESSGRWKWQLPERACFPGCCTDVVTASREWWEYAPSEAKPHPMAEAVQLRDSKWYWVIPSAARSPQVAPKGCPYCTSDNEAIRNAYFDQNCAECVKRMFPSSLSHSEPKDPNLTPENAARIEETYQGLVGQHFDCHYNGEPAKCDKDCAKLGYCKRRTSGPIAPSSTVAPSAIEHLIGQVERGESFDRGVMLKTLRSAIAPTDGKG